MATPLQVSPIYKGYLDTIIWYQSYNLREYLRNDFISSYIKI